MPDFFIVGAPKCGTTALHSYLSSHPEIFLPSPDDWISPVAAKEPHYYCSDFPKYRRFHSRDQYLRLFSQAPASSLIGEASVWYLYSKVAIPQIIADNPSAKFIVLLRNPVDMVHSLHNLLYHTLDEDIADIQQAWDMQGVRRQGQRIPPHCREPSHLFYKEVCSFAHQIERLHAHVPREQCLMVIFEEFAAAPEETYRRVLAFLGLRDDGRSDFPRMNASAARRSRVLTVALRTLPRRLGPLYGPTKSLVNAVRLRPGVALARWNRKERPRAPLDPAFERRLAAEFAPDVERLEQLLGRSLDHWRSAANVELDKSA